MCIVFICKLLLYGGGGYCPLHFVFTLLPQVLQLSLFQAYKDLTMYYQWSNCGMNWHCHSSVLALARSMKTTCASNHCYQNLMESLITWDIIPSLSYGIIYFSFAQIHSASLLGERSKNEMLYDCTTFHFFDLSPSSYFVLLNLLITLVYLITPSFLSGFLWNLHQSFTLQANQPMASHYTKLRIHFTLHVGICRNFNTKRINCMKLYTHKLRIYL